MSRRRTHPAATVVLVCALVLAWSLAVGSVATAYAVTLENYAAGVAEARSLAARAPGEMTQRQATDLAIAVNELVPASVDVETADGTLAVDNSVTRALVAGLDAADTPDERADAAADLAAHLASMERTLGRRGPALAENPEALERLLEAQAPQARSPFGEYFGQLVERLGRLLERWWSTIGASPGASTALTTVTVIVIAVLAALLVWLAVRAFLRARAGTQRREAPLAPIAERDAVIEAARDLPLDALAYADERAAAGDVREALRALFGGAARELQAAGFVVEARLRTNRDLLLEVRPQSPRAYPPLEALSRVFERAWYGHHAVSADEYAESRTWFLGVREAIQVRAGDGA